MRGEVCRGLGRRVATGEERDCVCVCDSEKCKDSPAIKVPLPISLPTVCQASRSSAAIEANGSLEMEDREPWTGRVHQMMWKVSEKRYLYPPGHKPSLAFSSIRPASSIAYTHIFSSFSCPPLSCHIRQPRQHSTVSPPITKRHIPKQRHPSIHPFLPVPNATNNPPLLSSRKRKGGDDTTEKCDAQNAL